MEHILPCPFCDNCEVEWNSREYDGAVEYWWLECPGCGASGPTGSTIELAALMWNNR